MARQATFKKRKSLRFFFSSQVDELDVEALDLLQHLILGEDLLEGEGFLVEDVVDGTARGVRRTRMMMMNQNQKVRKTTANARIEKVRGIYGGRHTRGG